MARVLALLTLVATLLVGSAAGAASISLVAQGANPNNLRPGDTLLVELRVSGLGNLVAPTLGAFDLTVAFGAVQLGFQSLSYGGELSAPGFPSQALAPVTSPGRVQATELVAADPGACPAVEAQQPASFGLFTITFTAGAAGSTNVSVIDQPPVNGLFLFDCSFTPIPIDVEPASLQVTVRDVAEPGLALGLGAAGLALAGGRRPRSRRA